MTKAMTGLHVEGCVWRGTTMRASLTRRRRMIGGEGQKRGEVREVSSRRVGSDGVVGRRWGK